MPAIPPPITKTELFAKVNDPVVSHKEDLMESYGHASSNLLFLSLMLSSGVPQNGKQADRIPLRKIF